MHREPGIMTFSIASHHRHLVESITTKETNSGEGIKGSTQTIIDGSFGYFRVEILKTSSFIISRLRASLKQPLDIVPHTDTPMLCWYGTILGEIPATLAGKGPVTLKEQQHGMYYIPAYGTNAAQFPAGDYEAVYISFSTAFLHGFIDANEQFHDLYDRKCERSEEGVVLPYFDFLLDEWNVLQQIYHHNEEGHLLPIFLDMHVRKLLFNYFKSLQVRDQKENNIDRFQRLKEYIDRNIGADLRINTMSKEVGYISRGRLNKEFKAKMGIGIKEYVERELRREAEHLLSSQPSMSIIDIALKLGYKDQSYFGTMFKKWTGKSPSDYRKVSVSTSES